MLQPTIYVPLHLIKLMDQGLRPSPSYLRNRLLPAGVSDIKRLAWPAPAASARGSAAVAPGW